MFSRYFLNNIILIIVFIYSIVVFNTGCVPVPSPQQQQSISNIQIQQDTLRADSLYKTINKDDIEPSNALVILDEIKNIREKYCTAVSLKLAQTYFQFGEKYYKLNQFSKSIIYYQKGLDIQKKRNDTLRMATYSVKLSNAKIGYGQILEAKSLVSEAIYLLNQSTPSPLKDEYYSYALTAKASVYQFEKNYLESFKMDSLNYKLLKDDEYNRSSFAATTCNLAINMSLLGKHSDALLYFQKAILQYERLVKAEPENIENYAYIANIQNEIANVYFRQENIPLAFKHYDIACQILQKNKYPQPTYIAEAFQGIGNCYFVQKKYNLASGAFENATKYLSLNDSIEYATNPRLFLEIKLLKLKCVKILYPKDKDKLLQEYQRIEKIISYIQQNTTHDDSKINLTEQSLELYEEAIGVAFSFYQETKNQYYFEQALSFAERNKAVILREGLQDNFAKKYSGVSEELLQQERDLKIELAYSQKQLFDASNDSLKSVWKSEVYKLQSSIDKFNRDLKESNPKYHKLRYETVNSLTVSEIQDDLKPKSLLLEYFLGEKTLYTFAISKTKYQVYSRDLPSNWDAMLQNIRDAVGNNQGESRGYLENTYPLYQCLLEKPLADFNKNNEITRLRIVPDGRLGYISFDYLCTKQPDGWQIEDKPNWVLEKYATSYLYSNTLLQPNKIATNFSNSVGFGLNYQNRSPFQELINAPEEAEKIARLTYGKAYTNANATLDLFKKEAPNASIIHLAMHGIIDEKNPLNSALIFAESPEGDRLSAIEIYNMQLKSGLAVLSACNTGNGKLQRGEGIMSLARAFAFAGCPSMVVSLWSIPEESTSNIMNRFYENLKNGDEKDVALQKAKLAYFKDVEITPNNTKPNSWAASVIIGDIEPIEIGYPLAWKLATTLLFLALGFGIYYRRRLFFMRYFMK
jgi:CHAT domain-containing protein